jgi:hypothetical protein
MLRTFVLYRTGTSVKGAACDAGEQSEWHRKPPHLPYSYVRRFPPFVQPIVRALGDVAISILSRWTLVNDLRVAAVPQYRSPAGPPRQFTRT